MKFDEAREEMLHGMRILDELQVRPRYAVALLRLGELYANAGEREPAIENLNKADGMFKEMEMNYYIHKTQEIFERL